MQIETLFTPKDKQYPFFKKEDKELSQYVWRSIVRQLPSYVSVIDEDTVTVNSLKSEYVDENSAILTFRVKDLTSIDGNSLYDRSNFSRELGSKLQAELPNSDYFFMESTKNYLVYKTVYGLQVSIRRGDLHQMFSPACNKNELMTH